MTARIGRLSWVYDSIAYATTLKHVGVLQQTLYLVATMLGLAPCALAMGDAELATERVRAGLAGRGERWRVRHRSYPSEIGTRDIKYLAARRR